MVLHFVAETMGEGPLHAFKVKFDAELFAAENEGAYLNKLTYASPPSLIFAVCCGDRGCVSSVVAAFPDKASAEKAASKANKADTRGLGYGVW